MAQKKPGSDVWTAEERAAMKEGAAEAKRAAKRGADDAAGEADLLAKIAEMPEPDRSMAARIHEIVKAAAPALASKTWYGMPRTRRTAGRSASSRRRRSSRCGTRPSGSSRTRDSMTARCGRMHSPCSS